MIRLTRGGFFAYDSITSVITFVIDHIFSRDIVLRVSTSTDHRRILLHIPSHRAVIIQLFEVI